MNSDHIKIYKSFEERLKEYKYILQMFSPSCAASYSLSEISVVWTNYLELHLITKGWNAIWYVLRKSCADLKISFPKIVEVMVENVNFDTLTAEVIIISNDDDDIEIRNSPKEISVVPLKDLYITSFQENPEIDAYVIAEYIDQLRLFYHHLWWPWDAEPEFSCTSWAIDHLENRLRMYYDKLQGNVHYITGKTIKHLMEKGEEMYEKVKAYSLELPCLREEELFLHVDVISEMEKCFNELELIKAKLRKWEIPQLRKLEDEKNRIKSSSPRSMIVICECDAEEIDSCLQRAKPLVNRDEYESLVLKKLEDGLIDYYKGDTIILCSEDNPLTPREYFDFPINLIGLPGRKITISDTRSHWCLFESISEDVRITNVNFEVEHVRSVITIKRGCVTLDHVSIEKINDRPLTAIHVYEGAEFVAKDCSFVNFDVAIVCFGRASVSLHNCNFRNNNVCLKVSPDSKLFIENCDMVHTKSVPIQLEVGECIDGTINSLNCLKNNSGIQIHCCQFKDESKAVEVV